MGKEKRIVESEIRVRYAETDAMGIVYHTNYIIWFEVGRGDYFRTVNNESFAEWEARGINFPLSEVYARYHAPARYGDLVRVRTWVEEVRSRGMTFGYEIVDAAGKTLVTGYTVHLCVNHEGRVCRLPPDLATAMGGA
ncbi:MAG: acyl-CoA thioesterase [Chloroflexi bacterium]|nr:acyl-CoA thioesterase [Chloroflexota bacterium]